jgi:hypothetical protein
MHGRASCRRLALPASTAPFQPYELPPAQTLTANGRYRAKRTIARRLRGRLAPGTHPLQAVLTELCPGALEALSGRLLPAGDARGGVRRTRAGTERPLRAQASLELSLGGPLGRGGTR